MMELFVMAITPVQRETPSGTGKSGRVRHNLPLPAGSPTHGTNNFNTPEKTWENP
jgi:hypothetical protein